MLINLSESLLRMFFTFISFGSLEFLPISFLLYIQFSELHDLVNKRGLTAKFTKSSFGCTCTVISFENNRYDCCILAAIVIIISRHNKWVAGVCNHQRKERTKDISPQVRIPSTTSKRMDRLAGARSTTAAVFFLPAAPVVRRF